MSAAPEKNRVSQGLPASPNIKHLAVIAGGGSLPFKLLDACDRRGIIPFVVGFEGQTDRRVVQGRNHMWTRLGAAGQILNTLKAHQIRDLVLIGSIRRPSFSELRPDFKTAEFFTRIGLKALGDNDVLSILRRLLEEEGFTIHGIQHFADDLLAPSGVLGKYKPGKADWPDIWRGVAASRALGIQDIGQSIIVQEGMVLAVEAAEGTDELMLRSRHLRRKGRKPILVKTCKPQQDRNFDLPTIGPDTLKIAIECGLGGVVVHSGCSLLLNPQKVADLADEHKIFVVGINPDDAPESP